MKYNKNILERILKGKTNEIQNDYNKNAGKTKTGELINALPWAYCVRREEYINSTIKTELCVVVHKDGCVQQCFGFRGNDLDSFSESYTASVSMYFNEAVKRLGDGWMVSIEAQRYITRDYPESEYDIEAGYLVEQERKESFMAYGEHYDSSYFMNIVYMPEPKLKRKMTKVFFTEIDYEREQEEIIDDFIKETKRIVSILDNKL